MIDSIVIETSAVCNLRCSMCPTLAYAGSRNLMGDSTFQKVASEIAIIKPTQVNLSGWGEPFMDRKITERIKMISNMGIQTSIISNFTLPDEKKIEDLVETGISNILISFDGGTKRIYENIRINANFEKTFGNIDKLSNLIAKRKKNISLSLAYVMMKENKDDLQILCDRLKEKGVNLAYIYVKPLDVVSNKSNFAKIISVSEIKRTVKKLKTGYNIHVSTAGENKNEGDCLASVQSSLFINYEGKVSPCCNLGHPVPRMKDKYFFKVKNSQYFVGDTNKETLEYIWNNGEYKEFRNEIKRGGVPKPCKYCNLI